MFAACVSIAVGEVSLVHRFRHRLDVEDALFHEHLRLELYASPPTAATLAAECPSLWALPLAVYLMISLAVVGSL